MRVAVTGASGFIGSSLVPYLERRGHDVDEVPRSALMGPAGQLRGCYAVVHLAGIAHKRSVDPAEMDFINHQLPVLLAKRAAEAGVRRFIFMSSVAAVVSPQTDYGRAKAAAEAALLKLDSIEVIILRPPLVYGPNAPGNIARLMAVASLPVPLPFASAHNKRSLIYIGNLVDAVSFVLGHPHLNGAVFNVTDGEDVTLQQIVSLFRQGLGRPSWLFRAPWLEATLKRAGAGRLATQLLGELRIAGNELQAFGWSPPFRAIDALKDSARGASIDPPC